MRYVLGALLLVAGSQVASAANYGMAGCGLGSLVFDSEGSQISAGTTNALGYNQGFAISSGTSNCVDANGAAQISAQEKFFAANLKTLSRELAQGDGEYVRALARTMGCSDAVHGAFGAEMQKQYSYIFSAPGAMSMLGRVRSTIHSSKDLNGSCNTII